MEVLDIQRLGALCASVSASLTLTAQNLKTKVWSILPKRPGIKPHPLHCHYQ